MLQIISGKFFKRDCYKTPSKAILYSNYSWWSKIDTKLVKITSIESSSAIASSYLIEYINKFEKPESEQAGGVVAIGFDDIVDQFRLLASFSLRAYFHIDKNQVINNCRKTKKDSSDKFIPSFFIPRYFDTTIYGSREDNDKLKLFLNKAIDLERKKYNVLIKCLRNFFDSLEVLNYNFDLAYSMMVYSLETLSQNFDGYAPVWEDYEQEVRLKLEKELEKIPDDISDNLKNILLESSHLKLLKRFKEFIMMYLSDDYFTIEASQTTRPARFLDIERALINLYNSRSKYVHTLNNVQRHLKHHDMTSGDILYWQNEPHFTFKGLTRLVHHVITNFVFKQQSIKKQDYDINQEELPGILTFNLAPQYWLGNIINYDIKDANKRLSTFLELIEGLILFNNQVIDLNNLIKDYEKKISQVNEQIKIPILNIYLLFNVLLPEQERLSNEQNFLNKYKKDLEKLYIQNIVSFLLLNMSWHWEIDKIWETYKNYLKNRFKNKSFVIPNFINIWLLTQIANKFLDIKNKLQYKEIMNISIKEASGLTEVQTYLSNSLKKKMKISFDELKKSYQECNERKNKK